MQKPDLVKEAAGRNEWRYSGAKGSRDCGQLHCKSPDKKSQQSHPSMDQITEQGSWEEEMVGKLRQTLQ